MSWGELIGSEERQERKHSPIQKVGRHLIYIQMLGIYLTCDCTHTLVPITMQEIKNELRKQWNLVRSGVLIKIEL
jgi:hypothetical protein